MSGTGIHAAPPTADECRVADERASFESLRERLDAIVARYPARAGQAPIPVSVSCAGDTRSGWPADRHSRIGITT